MSSRFTNLDLVIVGGVQLLGLLAAAWGLLKGRRERPR